MAENWWIIPEKNGFLLLHLIFSLWYNLFHVGSDAPTGFLEKEYETMYLIAEEHKPYDFKFCGTLTCIVADKALAAWQAGDLDARREYARYLLDHHHGRTGALAPLAGIEFDVRYLLSRKASPRLGRPEQCIVIYVDGREAVVDGGVWRLIYQLAQTDHRLHWRPSVRRYDDLWTAKWGRVELDGNEYGRLLAGGENA